MPEIPQGVATARLATLFSALRGEPGTLTWDGSNLVGTFVVNERTYKLQSKALLPNFAPFSVRATLEYDSISDLNGDDQLEIQLGSDREIFLVGRNGLRIKGVMDSSPWRMSAGSGRWSCS
ncbi:hypothetical protein RhiJN_09532 [Ceratobasidium sp. AG-Ba]|nr:hypothetical protein RhiJN_09532 [Ceratobasidium sp. AG-Ba]